jgi:hypothetical protein
MVNLIPVFALLLTVIVGICVVITIVKRIESKVERIFSKANNTDTLDNAILTTEAAVKWFLREKNMEVNHSYGHYNVQSVCLNCYRSRPECCIGCSARRGKDLTLNREDVRWLASELESCTTRLVKEMHDTSKDSVDALALALNIKSGTKKK